MTLAIWPRASLAHVSGVPLSRPCATEFTLAHNVSSRDEVDALMAQAENAGATVTKPPHDTSWGGYAGYFLDPDQHLWEVVWNPQRLPQD